MHKYILIAALAATLTGCLEQGPSSKIDQSSVCTFSSEEDAKQCKEGQLAFFKPERWGNEQLPLLAASLWCDFNHPVMHTSGGVICVFTKQRTKEDKK
jgi:hypothetical protein